MNRATAERHLAAIMVADIVGYSRLMGADEAGTLRRLKALRREVIDPSIAAARGRIVKAMGDGLLAAFPSPLRAVACAVRIQRAMLIREAGRAPDQQFRLRVGINLGDVVEEPDGDVYGDGVNVAARLEPLAEPGGLCISRPVHDQVRDKLPYRFEDLGKRELKNIARPIGVFALSASAIGSLCISDEAAEEPFPSRSHPRKPAALAACAAVLLLAGGIGWWSWSALRAPAPGQPGAIPAASSANAPPLSLVVLPFANLNHDPEQEYFADGITEDLTTDLSHLDGSFVIARNTAFTYKGKPTDVRQVGRDLGVRYVLEGSVRRVEERVLLNAKLISADTGAQIWADRLEGDRSKLGELQAEFVARLARSLDVQLTQAESLRSLRERPNDPDAGDLAMRGWAALNRPRNPAHLREALRLFDEALQHDPRLVSALVGKARSLTYLAWLRWSETPEKDLAAAEAAIAQVLSDMPDHAMAHFVRGDILKARKKPDLAIPELETAIANDRNLALAYEALGHAKILLGRSTDALVPIEKALLLSPHDPALNLWLFHMCHAYTHMARYSEAIPWCLKSNAVAPLWLSYVDLAAGYAWTGQAAEAHNAVAELLKLMPNYTVEKWANAGFSDNPQFLAEYQRIVEGLRMAGLPER
nr:adenylate/guanylate cyclase domain-containing protein [Methylobacterium nodulans]